MRTGSKRRQRGMASTSRAAAVLVTVGVLVAAGCADSRDASQGEETVPRITSAPTAATVVASTPVPTVATGPPVTPPATIAPTAPPTPWPAPLTTDPPTDSPATQGSDPPSPAPTAPPPPTAPDPPTPPDPAPARPPTTAAASAPTSTLVVSAAAPAACSADAIGADTGDLDIANVSCNAGWAIGLIDGCPAGRECEGVDVFHITPAGWVHDGYFYAVCAEGLTGAGMSIHTAATFVPNFCEGSPAGTGVIRPGSSGDRVIHLQTALIAEGYQLAADGTYGPRTQAAVRDFQAANGLEVDGIAGPQTQAALGIGPDGQAATSPTTAAPTAATVTTVTSSSSTSTTIVLRAGEPLPCTADAIGAEINTSISEITACRSGWAIGRIDRCPAQTVCEDVDVFHATEDGWVYDGHFGSLCADDLGATGMSPYTAGELGSSSCAIDDPPAQPPIIRPGSTGDDVRNLQVALVALGYPIAADGTYGPRTQAAIRDYQADNGLAVDGIAGPQTRRALGV